MNAIIIVCGEPQGGIGGRVDSQFKFLQSSNPKKFLYINKYTEKTAHQLLAGSDILLHPSRFEPCGLTQQYAIAYGTLPIVTSVGGLKDTITCSLQYPEKGFGFHMQQYSYQELCRVLKASVRLYQNKNYWVEQMLRGMEQRTVWADRIQPYIELLCREFLHLKEHAIP